MSYRVFNPLPPDHPMIGDERCAKCHEAFKAGDRTILIPVDPQEQGGTVEALPAHAACFGWDEKTQAWNRDYDSDALEADLAKHGL